MAQLKVTMVASTQFHHVEAANAVGWKWEKQGDSTDAEGLVEFMGRSCYQSWSRSNPRTARTGNYLAHIEEVGHWSVMEHGTVTFYIQGVSRSLTHELVRHRHLSPSQLSQRFVKLSTEDTIGPDDFIVPPLFRNHTMAEMILMHLWEEAVDAYAQLIALAEEELESRGVKGTLAKKQSREAARAVLPNMTPTAIGMTGNHRAWREFLSKRLQPEADAEIRELAVEIFRQLVDHDPCLYQDLEIRERDGLPSLTKIGS